MAGFDAKKYYIANRLSVCYFMIIAICDKKKEARMENNNSTSTVAAFFTLKN
jgi:hypothetical protein